MGGFYPSDLKFKRISSDAIQPFLTKWKADLSEHFKMLQEEMEEVLDKKEYYESYSQEENAKWLWENFPEPDFEMQLWPEAVEVSGNWWFFNVSKKSDISPDTDSYNTFVILIAPNELPEIISYMAESYAKCIKNGIKDSIKDEDRFIRDFMDEAPSLINYLSEAMKKQEYVFLCHSNPC